MSSLLPIMWDRMSLIISALAVDLAAGKSKLQRPKQSAVSCGGSRRDRRFLVSIGGNCRYIAITQVTGPGVSCRVELVITPVCNSYESVIVVYCRVTEG